MSLFLEIGLFLLLSYVVLLFFFYSIQQRLLFHPTTGRYQPGPGEKAEPYTLQRGTIQLRGWLVNPGFVRRRLILYYGGNGENVFHNIDEFADIQAATLFVAYRGYSGSDGEPGEAALFADALAVIDDITTRYNPQQLFVMGRSLGSGVACYAAAKRQITGAILVTPFASISRLAKARYPWLPVSLLLKHKFLSEHYVKEATAPFLVLYGGRDRIVPPQETRLLLDAITSEKTEIYIKDADHGTIDMHPQYWPAVLAFLLGSEL